MKPVLRYLRIAFSAACLITCVLLIALWTKSHFQRDSLSWTVGSTSELQIASFRGGVTLISSPYSGSLPIGLYLWTETILTGSTNNLVEPPIPAKWGVGSRHIGGGTGVRICYWLPTTIFAMLAAAPWLPRNFSLRTLLIATTLVAVVLGLIAYATR
jgi:hypothetical protein